MPLQSYQYHVIVQQNCFHELPCRVDGSKFDFALYLSHYYFSQKLIRNVTKKLRIIYNYHWGSSMNTFQLQPYFTRAILFWREIESIFSNFFSEEEGIIFWGGGGMKTTLSVQIINWK